MNSLSRFQEPTAEEIAKAEPEPTFEGLDETKPFKITTPDRYHLTAHDKQLIRFCLDRKIDGCQSKRKTITLKGGYLRKGITPTHAEIVTRETNSFGKVAEKKRTVPFSVNLPKKHKDATPGHPELF